MSDGRPYIDIVFKRMSPTGKTKVWYVVNKRDPNDVPGIIKWNGGWRKYVYYSADAYYDWQCLRQIADHIEKETAAHKAMKALQK